MSNKSIDWWPLCFSETIPPATLSNKPVALFWGEQELAVYRDHEGCIRAVEDRCPHRRAPLSLGKITTNGHIQCGYHGWTFDGRTGDISSFPNLDEGERLPRCKIQTFPLREHNSVVYIGSSAIDTTPSGLENQHSLAANLPGFSGQATYALSHQECVVALLDNPRLFFNIFAVELLDKSYGDPKVEDGLLITEQAARWNLLGESRFYMGPLRHRADFPLLIKIVSVQGTGETLLTLSRQDGQIMAEIQMIFTPSCRGMTTAHWHSTINFAGWGKLSALLRLQLSAGRHPVELKPNIDASALAATLPSAGEIWRSASEKLTSPSINQEALC